MPKVVNTTLLSDDYFNAMFECIYYDDMNRKAGDNDLRMTIYFGA